MKKAISIIVFLTILFSLAACGTPAAETTPEATPVQTPAATPEPTPEPTPTPAPFSYETVFGEIFSDEALSTLYPDVEDYDKERVRISGNILNIEDFEFYELTAIEEEFIKKAQQGNADESRAEELREVLTKIYDNDPYVFDDVDNVVKIDNRINELTPGFQKLNLGIDDSKIYKIIKEVITVTNSGNIENVSTETGHIMLNMTAGKMLNQTYFYETVIGKYPSIDAAYDSEKWKGNYSVFDFSKFLLDGSEGQKIAKKLYEANVKFFNCEKEEIENGLKEIVGECLNILLINDALQKPGGINSIDSIVHYVGIYDYCRYIIISFSGSLFNDNITYIVPNEYAEKAGLPTTELSVRNIASLIQKHLGDIIPIYYKAFEELEQIQLEKYKNEVHIPRHEESEDS